ncbi:MAG: hypothetical protein AB7H93_04740 [Vicinamibacterales bacterium]
MPLQFAVTAVVLVLTFGSGAASAQSLGTFRWQLQPFCNVVTVNVIQQGAVYTVDGFDDQCGAPQRAPLVGLATPNPDGSIGLGLHVVTVPGGRGLDIEARISLATLGGPWSDSAGNTGTFAFGAAAGGSPRPLPTIPGSAIAPGSIAAAQLAPGAINAAAAAFGTCPGGQYLRGIQANGTVLCEPIGSPPVSTALPGAAGSVAYTSIAIGVDGLAVISHQDESAGTLRVTHCDNRTCSAATSTTVDDPPATVGAHGSIAIGGDGLAVVSHYDAGAQALRVTHCSNVVCTAATSVTIDDSASAVGRFTSIAIGTDGLPLISYLDDTAGTLRVTHCGNVACTAGNTSTTVDDPAQVVGGYTSLAIGSDGLGVIGHSDFGANTLRVTHCVNVACTLATSTTADSAAFVGVSTSLIIGSDGLPLIGHRDNAALALRVTHCANLTCTAATSATIDDHPVNSVGGFKGVALGTDGLAVIAHYDNTALVVRVTHCSNVACSAATSTTVDAPATGAGRFVDLAVGADGLPVMSYGDSGTGQLRVTKCASRTCQ